MLDVLFAAEAAARLEVETRAAEEAAADRAAAEREAAEGAHR